MAAEHVDTKGQMNVQAEVWDLMPGSQDPLLFFSHPTVSYFAFYQLMWKHSLLLCGDSRGQNSPMCFHPCRLPLRGRAWLTLWARERGGLLTMNLLHSHQGLEYMSLHIRKFHVPEAFWEEIQTFIRIKILLLKKL